MGLVLPLAILVAFRAGRLRGLTTENMEERLGDLAFDSVKDQLAMQVVDLVIGIPKLFTELEPFWHPSHSTVFFAVKL